MKNYQQIYAAIGHLTSAREGALRASEAACGEGDPRVALKMREDNAIKASALAFMIDGLRWALGEPSELAAMMRQFDHFDAIEKSRKEQGRHVSFDKFARTQ